jgi:histidinol phosphatase-like PHP family hydrolase
MMKDKDLHDFLAISGVGEPYLGRAAAYFREVDLRGAACNGADHGGAARFYDGKNKDNREAHIALETLVKYLRIAEDQAPALEILELWRRHARIPQRIRGDFHVHTEFSDGIDPTESLLRQAKRLGYSWLALCDHAPMKKHVYTLTPDRFFRRAEIAARVSTQTGVKAYQAIEADILPDGSLNIPPEIRGDLDFALASFHYRYPLSDTKQLELIESAFADDKVIGFAHPFFSLHPCADDNLLLPILDLAEKHGVAVELNLAPYFLRQNRYLVKLIRRRDLKVLLSTDAHLAGALALMRFAGLFLDGQLDARVLNFQDRPVF